MNGVPDVSRQRQPDTPTRTLAAYTTLRLGGPAGILTEITDSDQAVATVRNAAAEGRPVLVLAGGSNLVVGDAGFPGEVLLLRTRGIRVVETRAERPPARNVATPSSSCSGPTTFTSAPVLASSNAGPRSTPGRRSA